MKTLIFNDYLDAAIAGLFMFLVFVILISAIKTWFRKPTGTQLPPNPEEGNDETPLRCC